MKKLLLVLAIGVMLALPGFTVTAAPAPSKAPAKRAQQSDTTAAPAKAMKHSTMAAKSEKAKTTKVKHHSTMAAKAKHTTKHHAASHKAKPKKTETPSGTGY